MGRGTDHDHARGVVRVAVIPAAERLGQRQRPTLQRCEVG